MTLTAFPKAARSLLIATSIALGSATVAFMPAAAQAQGTAAAAQAEVRKVMEGYITASREADEPLMRSIFHPNAIMTGSTLGGKMSYGTPEGFFVRLGKMKQDPKRAAYGAAKVTQVSVSGDIGSGTIEESDFNGKRYTDMFQLVRADGKWLIISKTYYGVPVG